MNEKALDKTPPAADEYQATFAARVPRVQPPFQGMGGRDPGVCMGAQRRSKALLTLLSL
ncbi:hypothetical protein NQZ68_013709, partial [Dissostichus eleginoides]